MSFDESYQLLELAGDEGVKTFVARRISTGKSVTVFLFVSEQAQAHAELLDQLRTADRAQWPDLIEVGDNRGTIYVVMEPLLSFAALKERASLLKTAPPAPSEHKPEEFTRAGIWRIPPSLQSTPSRAEKHVEESSIFDKQPLKVDAPSAPESFTQMFQAAAPPIGESVPEAPVVPPAPPAAPEPKPSAPGEFTRMFQAAVPPMSEATVETPKAPPKQASPGSFTQMFQAAAPPMGEQKTKAPQKAPEPSGPGEFTRFFNASSAAPPTAAPIPPKQEAQGDFASIFGSGDRSAGPASTVTGMFHASSSTPAIKPEQAGSALSQPPPPAFTPPPGSFTRIFGETPPAVSLPGPMPAPSPPSAPSPASAPGEYTRMFSAQPLPQEPIAALSPPAIKAPEPTAQPKRSSMLIPVLIGVIVLLLAAIAVILVTIKK